MDEAKLVPSRQRSANIREHRDPVVTFRIEDI